MENRSRRWHPVVIFLMGLLPLILVASGCLCGIGVWWFRPITSQNAERVHQLVDQMVSISIPETFVPRGTIEWNIAFVMRLRGVYYERLVGDGVLSLVEVNSRLPNDDSVRQHIRETLLEEGSSGTMLVIDKQKTRKQVFELAGESVTFTFDIARDVRTNELFHLVEGVFQGNSGQVLLSLRVDSTRWMDEPASLDVQTDIESANRLPRWVEKLILSIGQPPVVEGNGTEAEPTGAGLPMPPEGTNADEQAMPVTAPTGQNSAPMPVPASSPSAPASPAPVSPTAVSPAPLPAVDAAPVSPAPSGT
ncbi:hypothetical protein [Planctomicrobium sp. SH527]|uniref:hypothetical protein n=1 Tax=Planctomicrobium sp. SH527 TaxID=3448123 RepID=UPI003F5B3657